MAKGPRVRAAVGFRRAAVIAIWLTWWIAQSIASIDPAQARGGLGSEFPLAAEHISGLPPGVQRNVLSRSRACGGRAAAGHYFSVSIEASGRRFISLHYEELSCINRAAVCSATGCLHEVYIDAGGRQTRVFAVVADDLTMTNARGVAGLEVTRGGTTTTMKWNGRQFVHTGRNGF